MQTVEELILASQSSYRRKLLEAAGLSFQSVTSRFDEHLIKHKDPKLLALNRAKGKAQEVASRFPGSLVIGADQVLSFNGSCFGKVASKEEAFQMIKLLSGNTHQLVNGVCLLFCANRGATPKVVYEDNIIVDMRMRPLTDDMINLYITRSFEWQGVAGCYQYEKQGVQLFEESHSDYSSIIGMPLIPLLNALRKIGIDTLVNAAGPWTNVTI